MKEKSWGLGIKSRLGGGQTKKNLGHLKHLSFEGGKNLAMKAEKQQPVQRVVRKRKVDENWETLTFKR